MGCYSLSNTEEYEESTQDVDDVMPFQAFSCHDWRQTMSNGFVWFCNCLLKKLGS